MIFPKTAGCGHPALRMAYVSPKKQIRTIRLPRHMLKVSREMPDNTRRERMDTGMKRKDRSCVGCCCAAFGVGLLTAAVCPTQLVLFFAAVALVLLGCSRARCR